MEKKKYNCGRKKQKLTIKSKHSVIKVNLLSFPGKDIAIEVIFNLICYPFDWKQHNNHFHEVASEWWEESHLDPKHFICNVAGPSGYQNNSFGPKRFTIELSVMSRKEINIDNKLYDLIINDLNCLASSIDSAIENYSEVAKVKINELNPSYFTPEINTSYLKNN